MDSVNGSQHGKVPKLAAEWIVTVLEVHVLCMNRWSNNETKLQDVLLPAYCTFAMRTKPSNDHDDGDGTDTDGRCSWFQKRLTHHFLENAYSPVYHNDGLASLKLPSLKMIASKLHQFFQDCAYQKYQEWQGTTQKAWQEFEKDDELSMYRDVLRKLTQFKYSKKRELIDQITSCFYTIDQTVNVVRPNVTQVDINGNLDMRCPHGRPIIPHDRLMHLLQHQRNEMVARMSRENRANTSSISSSDISNTGNNQTTHLYGSNSSVTTGSDSTEKKRPSGSFISDSTENNEKKRPSGSISSVMTGSDSTKKKCPSGSFRSDSTDNNEKKRPSGSISSTSSASTENYQAKSPYGESALTPSYCSDSKTVAVSTPAVAVVSSNKEVHHHTSTTTGSSTSSSCKNSDSNDVLTPSYRSDSKKVAVPKPAVAVASSNKENCHRTSTTSGSSRKNSDSYDTTPQTLYEKTIVSTLRKEMNLDNEQEILFSYRKLVRERQKQQQGVVNADSTKAVRMHTATTIGRKPTADDVIIDLVSQREEADKAKKMDQVRLLSELSRKEESKRLRDMIQQEFRTSMDQCTDIAAWMKPNDKRLFSKSWILHDPVLNAICQQYIIKSRSVTKTNYDDGRGGAPAIVSSPLKLEFLALLELEKNSCKWYGEILPKSYFVKYVMKRLKQATTTTKMDSTDNGIEERLLQQIRYEITTLNSNISSLSKQVGGVPKIFRDAYDRYNLVVVKENLKVSGTITTTNNENTNTSNTTNRPTATTTATTYPNVKSLMSKTAAYSTNGNKNSGDSSGTRITVVIPEQELP